MSTTETETFPVTIFEKDVELLEHMGDVLMRAGDYQNAVQGYSLALRWRMALKESERLKDRRERITGRTKRGAWAESIAVSFLIEQGYEVFRNVAPCGPIDLVAITDSGEPIYVDVKTTIPDRAGVRRYSQKPSDAQRALGVQYLYVNPNGTCEWETGLWPQRRKDDA